MADQKLNIAVFVSGGGSNLQALIDACADPDFPAQIVLVLSNNPNAGGLQRAASAGIATEVVDHKAYDSRDDFDAAVAVVLKDYPVELICLAGFMRILTPDFVNSWQDAMINIHPALLPRHGGEGMYGLHVHRSVLDAGDSESGASVHYVIPECDQGPVILQRRCPVMPDDTPETLAARVLQEEHKAYPEAVRLIAEGRVQSRSEKVEIL